MNTKRCLLFLCVGIVLVGVALFCVARSRSPGYRAESFIIVTPYTNAVFMRLFEAETIRANPGLLRLEVVPVRAVTLGATNGAGIRIIAVGSTAAEAHHAATNGAVLLCATVRELYGSTAELVDISD